MDDVQNPLIRSEAENLQLVALGGEHKDATACHSLGRLCGLVVAFHILRIIFILDEIQPIVGKADDRWLPEVPTKGAPMLAGEGEDVNAVADHITRK